MIVIAIPTHPNYHSMTYNIFIWNKSPETTIGTVVTVVTHHKIHIIGYDKIMEIFSYLVRRLENIMLNS